MYFDFIFDDFTRNKIHKFIDFILNYKYSFTNYTIFITSLIENKDLSKNISNIFKYLNYESFYINLNDLLNENISIIKDNDLVIVINGTINSDKLLKALKLLKNKNINGIFYGSNNILNDYYNNVLILPELNETDNEMIKEINIYISYYFFMKIFVHLSIKDKIISRNLLICDNKEYNKDLLKNNIIPLHKIKTININENIIINSKLIEIIKRMYNFSICFIVDNDNSLIGTITSENILCEFSKGNLIIVNNIINKNPEIIENQLDKNINELKLNIKTRYYPIIVNDKLYGIYDILN